MAFPIRVFGASMLALGLVLASAAEARIYKYVDDRGRQVFVDSLSKVPQQYRDQLESRQEYSEGKSPDELARERSERADQQRQQQFSQRRRELEQLLRTMETSVRVANNRVLVPVTVVYGGRSAKTRMVLDTGATSTVFHKDALSGLSYATRPGGYARVAGGGSIETQSVNFDRIEIGPYKVANVRAMVIDHQGPSVGNDGLLGMDFLMNARYKIDYERQLILWEPERYSELESLLRELDTVDAPP
ncbi:aspartyl protease family protein [Marinobacterium aestuariivivens]|uniref:Aspartyl protease family protein n=1 Tax=Marinobacterium aestuariivivens TaxID=1698799 RepID=A0ABW1ZVK7_9GAMM